MAMDGEDMPSRRVSLVEKAAERLAEARKNASAPPTGRGPVPSSRHRETEVEAPSSSNWVRDDNAALATRASPEALPRNRDTEANREEGSPRRSVTVNVDLQRLTAYGVSTPDRKRSQIAEEFRMIKRSVLANCCEPSGANPANLIMVTSSLPGEGKTFVSLNLAISIALERDFRVLLVDADLARPNLLRVLGIEARRGLVDILFDQNLDLAEVLLRTDIDGLSVLPPGRPNDLNTELLASKRMSRLVEEMACRYPDRILIFDSAPLLVTSEAAALARHMGQILFVVRANETGRSSVETALKLIEPGPRIGLVLNQTRRQWGASYFGYFYKNGYYHKRGDESQSVGAV